MGSSLGHIHWQTSLVDGGPQLHCSPSSEDWTTSPRPETPRPVTERPKDTPAYDLSRLRSSSVEIREKGSEILRDELLKAQKELKLRDEECERLSKVREQLEQELEELTASLFEEAHKMVRDANIKQAASEKQLREAHGKIDMLQAEVTALKTLVITSTPSSPNRDLHPQLQSPSKNALRKGHARNKSTGCAAVVPLAPPPQPVNAEAKEFSTVPSLLSLLLCIVPGKVVHLTYEPGWPLSDDSSSSFRQVDTILYSEFMEWKENPTLDKSCPFLSRIYKEDIKPCLDFAKKELSEQVLIAVEDNTLSVEPVTQPTLPVVKASAIERGGPRKCALSGLSRSCRHRIKLGDSGNYYFISPSCRFRITAVCNFFTYIRYIQQGLVRQDTELIFWEIMRLRREMSSAKLGFYPYEP
ncbi:guanine nucleotide exchange factor for Rab-3A isoform X4 [Hyla sarda]|uniref:guanine nucleotide exchange factor for Rab-3A isoform X4 n=1 Tax=Hyla sarda TaxID=327740 RepID=UPI0024C41811|nr:guanine nucleotide exchange factor for Rab-3A isoform X4 [Hyla sarda]